MIRLRGTDDGSGDEGLLENPRQRDLRTRDAALERHRGNALDDHAVGIRRARIECLAEFIRLLAIARLIPVACEPPACERAPWDHTDLLRHAERHHLPLLFAIEE